MNNWKPIDCHYYQRNEPMKHQSMPVCLQKIITIAKFGFSLIFSTVSYLFLVRVVLIFHHTTIFQLLSTLTGQHSHNGCGQLSSQHCERHAIYIMSLIIDNVIGEVHVPWSRIIEYYLGIPKPAKSRPHFVTVSILLVHCNFKDVVYFAL